MYVDDFHDNKNLMSYVLCLKEIGTRKGYFTGILNAFPNKPIMVRHCIWYQTSYLNCRSVLCEREPVSGTLLLLYISTSLGAISTLYIDP